MLSNLLQISCNKIILRGKFRPQLNYMFGYMRKYWKMENHKCPVQSQESWRKALLKLWMSNLSIFSVVVTFEYLVDLMP